MTISTIRRLNLSVLFRALVLACAVGLLGLLSGRIAISRYGLGALELLAAIPILIFVTRRPFAACLLLLALLASAVFYNRLPRADVPGRPPINIGDIVLIATVGATLWRRPWRVWPVAVKRFSVALAAMLLLAVIPTIVLATHGHSPARNAIAGYKDLLFITLALTVALELSGRLWWPMLNAVIVLSALVAVLSNLAAASGALGHLLTSVDATAVTAAGAATGTTSRIRLPGLFLVYAMTIPTLVIVLLVKDRWRYGRLVALLLMIAAIGVSLNRNMYYGSVAGLLVTLLLGGTQLRYRFLLTIVTIAAITALVVETTVAPAVTTEISTRAQSALSTQVLSTNSAQARADEFSHALISIKQHPWIGVGWFQNYGSYELGVPRQGVEDWYLDVATDLGIPVALAFLGTVGILLAYGVGRARRAVVSLDRAMVAAATGALTALLLSCLVGTYLQDPDSMTAFAFTCGLLLAAGMRPTSSTSTTHDRPGTQARPD